MQSTHHVVQILKLYANGMYKYTTNLNSNLCYSYSANELYAFPLKDLAQNNRAPLFL